MRCSIVCVSSVDGSRSAPYHASYGAAKAGLSNLVKTMSVEWAPHGIRANVVAPGAILTPRIPHLGENEGMISDRIPMRRRGTVEEIGLWPHPDGSMSPAIRIRVARYSAQIGASKFGHHDFDITCRQ